MSLHFICTSNEKKEWKSTLKINLFCILFVAYWSCKNYFLQLFTWSKLTYLKFIKSSFNYLYQSLKWIKQINKSLKILLYISNIYFKKDLTSSFSSYIVYIIQFCLKIRCYLLLEWIVVVTAPGGWRHEPAHISSILLGSCRHLLDRF